MTVVGGDISKRYITIQKFFILCMSTIDQDFSIRLLIPSQQLSSCDSQQICVQVTGHLCDARGVCVHQNTRGLIFTGSVRTSWC